MNTKTTLVENIHVTDTVASLLGRIDFSYIETFVASRLAAFVDERGIDLVRYDLNYDVHTPSDEFIAHLLEVDSVSLLKDSGLLNDSRYIDALYIIISSINIVIAEFLRNHQIAEVASYRYFDADPQFVLLERAVEQADKAAGRDQLCNMETTFASEISLVSHPIAV